MCILNTLRNRSEQETMATMHQLIPNNDHMRNKDRQDPTAVVTLTNPELTKYLKGLGPVSHTLIPERLRFTEGNKPGMFPNPVSVTIGNYGTILFLCKKPGLVDITFWLCRRSLRNFAIYVSLSLITLSLS